MTFGYVGYVWALLGCSCLFAFVGGTAIVLHVVGRRMERGRARVEQVPLRPARPGLPARPDDPA